MTYCEPPPPEMFTDALAIRLASRSSQAMRQIYGLFVYAQYKLHKGATYDTN